MHERPSDLAPPPTSAPYHSAPPPHERPYVPPPPADTPFWLHPFVLGGAIIAVLLLAFFLWTLPGSPPSDELSPEELAALLAAPPPPTDLPPRWETPTRASDLHLDTNPAGASVQLNSEWVGTTPIRLDDVSPGFYELRIVKPDYAPKDTSFYLASGSLLRLDVPLTPESFEPPPLPAPTPRSRTAPPRRPRASTESSATDRASRNAPEAPRRLQREGQPAGGGTSPTEFEVVSPEAVRQAAHTGSLSVTSNPSGAIVLVDGVPFGRAPLALSDLRPGRYVVTVTLPGYTPLSYHAEVTAQSVSVVKATFPPHSEQ